MARIRSFKPEVFSDSATGRLSGDAFRLFFGLISHADDYGFLVADLPQIVAQVLPFAGWSKLPDIIELFGELQDAKAKRPTPLVGAVEHEGQVYFVLPNFCKHQLVDKPSAPLIPFEVQKILLIKGFMITADGEVQTSFDYAKATFGERSGNGRRTLGESSESAPGTVDDHSRSRGRARARSGSDLIGSDRRGRESGERESAPPGATAPEPPPPSSASPLSEPEPEVWTDEAPIDSEGVLHAWAVQAKLRGRVAGPMSAREASEIAKACPDAPTLRDAMTVAFLSESPPAPNFFAKDLGRWVDLGQRYRRLMDSGDREPADCAREVLSKRKRGA